MKLLVNNNAVINCNCSCNLHCWQ